MDYVPPSYKSDGFNCPHCNAYSRMEWDSPWSNAFQVRAVALSRCDKCGKFGIWRTWSDASRMLWPDSTQAPPPEADMPEDVRRDYLEASAIFAKSSRGGSALLRLALQKLCRHLGEPGKNIDQDIRALASKGIFPAAVVKVADTVRITGNNAVHPGEMSDEDFDTVSSKLFELLNFLVRKAITEPKELDSLYAKVPEGARKAAEEKDEKNRAT